MPFSSVGAALAFVLSVSQPQQNSQNPPPAQTGATVVVTAQKEPQEAQRLPVSVTAVPAGLLRVAGVTFVSEAGVLSPNTQFTEFSARKLSNPRIRGIGASPANPGVVTYVDGVPQFSSNSSSFELIGVEQVEFVRGAQSALFGRNALGGLINIVSTRPDLSVWSGEVAAPVGSDGQFDVRAGASGPIVPGQLAAGFSMAYARRDGFTTNMLSGNDLDSRRGFSGKGQLLWTPNDRWEVRGIVSGERARDGDYALGDLAAIRQTPFQVARDFEGRTDRDILSSTIVARTEGPRFAFTSITRHVLYKII